jgi:histidine ammonia-lyase
VLHDAVRERSPRLDRDRSLADEIDLVAAGVRDGSLLAQVEGAAGELR